MAKRKKRKSSERPALLFYLFLMGMGTFAIYRYQAVLLEYIHVIIPVLGFVLLLLLIKWRRRRRLASSLKEVDRMGGHEFERFLVRLFKKHGFDAKNVGAGGGDFGADLIIEKDGVRIAVQAKNYTSGRVGNDAVQQAIAGATFYDCDQAMVVTNARYTQSAFKQASGCQHFRVTLWDRDAISKLIGG